MKRLPATHFIRNIGRILREAAAEPVTVTVHGQDSVVVLSASEYRNLVAHRDPPPVRPAPGRIADPWRTALSILNTSRAARTDREALVRALRNPEKANKATLRIFFSDVDEKTMAAVVRAGPVGWSALQRASEFVGDVDREKTSFIRDMAALAVETPAADRNPGP